MTALARVKCRLMGDLQLDQQGMSDRQFTRDPAIRNISGRV